MDASLIPQGSHGTMVEEEEEEEELRSVSSSSESFSSNSNASSSSSDSMDDATSSASPSSPATEKDQHDREPLNEMSSLLAHLPLKRGLSRYYQGSSQTFTSLSDVKCLEDLAKPERPHRKKMKSCRSYVWGLDNQKPLFPKQCSKTITKKASKSSLSCLGGRRHNFVSGRPAVPPHRSSNFSGQSLLLA
ncbi:protein OXIDATIVE STRESS 3-like [Musa acuminata AAA Group]|uniref:protein OXIDATIVE STRESS 3-like n=1 Tax=Musa acuminata AAA Group TaxID=214697 RepID=UPI0031D91E03